MLTQVLSTYTSFIHEATWKNQEIPGVGFYKLNEPPESRNFGSHKKNKITPAHYKERCHLYSKQIILPV